MHLQCSTLLLHNPNPEPAAKSLQLCLTLCNSIDGSPSGSPVPGILQARTLEWVAISFSNAWKWKVKVKSLSRFWLLMTPWTAAYQAPPSMGFSRQEYWSGLPLPGGQKRPVGSPSQLGRAAARIPPSTSCLSMLPSKEGNSPGCQAEDRTGGRWPWATSI